MPANNIVPEDFAGYDAIPEPYPLVLEHYHHLVPFTSGDGDGVIKLVFRFYQGIMLLK